MVIIPEYFKPVFEHTKESFIDLLNNPCLGSDPMITKAPESLLNRCALARSLERQRSHRLRGDCELAQWEFLL